MQQEADGVLAAGRYDRNGRVSEKYFAMHTNRDECQASVKKQETQLRVQFGLPEVGKSSFSLFG